MFKRIKLFRIELMVIFSFFAGCTVSNWANQSFSPYDFKSYKGSEIELMITQSLDSILPMSEHLIEVHYRRLDPKKNHNWQLAKKIWLDPFNLEDIEVVAESSKLSIKFPWGHRLSTVNYDVWEKSWDSNYLEKTR